MGGFLINAPPTFDPAEFVLVVATLTAGFVNAYSTVRAYLDMRGIRRRSRDGLLVLRARRRFIFMVQALVAQLWLLGGVLHCATLPVGPEQATIKTWILVGLALQLGLKAVVDLAFMHAIDRYPLGGRRVGD